MAYTTVDDPSQYFQMDLYTGDGQGSGNNIITNDGNSDLQPDWIWTKEITGTSGNQNHTIIDTSRGITKQIFANLDSAEATSSAFITQIDTDGFRLGDNANINNNGSSYVAWQWKANGGTTSSNNDGSYTSTVQANTTAGFSIVKYGDASSFSASTPATVGHGLGKAPKWIIIKNLDGTRDWGVHHSGLTDASKVIFLNLTNAESASNGFMNSTAPSSTVFTVNTLNVANGNNLEYIAYCFAEIKGYSKFGSYKGNGNADGPFVYTGFKPAYLLGKNTASAGNHWFINDNKRGFNGGANWIKADSGAAQLTNLTNPDFLSNGFKIRNNNAIFNENNSNYIYMAFAEHPFVSSQGVPVTAK
jgi:hypothetical protein